MVRNALKNLGKTKYATCACGSNSWNCNYQGSVHLNSQTSEIEYKPNTKLEFRCTVCNKKSSKVLTVALMKLPPVAKIVATKFKGQIANENTPVTSG